jgi:SulP family sulfate permease
MNPLTKDLTAALAVTLMAVPQGVAYAILAGLPPMVGLLAAGLPAIVGSLTRSSGHVVTGPTNALSLLVGATIATLPDPITGAAALAALTGLLQLAAGVFRLGVLVDYISGPVVRGYITGAGVLIAVGQLPTLTGSPGGPGTLPQRLASWFAGLGDLSAPTLMLGLMVVAILVFVRAIRPRWPSELIALAGATLLVLTTGVDVITIGDIAAIPGGIPVPAMPQLDQAGWFALGPAALAAAILSTVESSSVGRSIATRSGQRLNLDRELAGQGLANLTASVTGGMPISGSLSRSELNHAAGATGRRAGVFSGAMVLFSLLALGPAVDAIPLTALAGLLMVVAWQLVNPQKSWRMLRPADGDSLAFVATAVGTWLLPLDRAIALGVGISLILFLRTARHLSISELGLSREGLLAEGGSGRCEAVRILHVEGQLFFAAARTLEAALFEAANRPGTQAIILRLKRTQGMDRTAADVLTQANSSLRAKGQRLYLVGLTSQDMQTLQKAGTIAAIGTRHVFPTRARWFGAVHDAIDAALDATEACHCQGDCPLRDYRAA